MYMPSSSTATTGTRRKLTRIDIWSAAKVWAVLTTVIWAVFGLFFVVCGLCGFLGGLSNLSTNDSGGAGALAFSGVGFIFVYLIGLVFYAVIGGIVGALYAWVYNITVRYTGGLEVDVS
jgi:hypothetical protein